MEKAKRTDFGWWAAVLFGGLCVLLPIAAILLFCWQPLSYMEKSVSPGGGYTVVVKHSDGQWPFGPARVRITAKDGLFHRESYDTEICDDGGPGSIDVRWLDADAAQVTLRGSEQQAELITIDFSDHVKITSEREETVGETVHEHFNREEGQS